MFEELLAEIRGGGTLETGKLATRLGVSPQLLQAMLEHLERSGRIRGVSPCGESCLGCSLASLCAHPAQAPLRLWQGNREG